MSKRFISFMLCLVLTIGLIPASTSADSIENFPFDPNKNLALQAARYAILANDNYTWDSAKDIYYMKSIKSAENTQPTQLTTLLTQQSFSNVKCFNYDKTEENNSSFVIAQKSVMYNGEQKKLVVLSLRATSGNQWKGNMDITGSKYVPGTTTHVNFELAANGVITELENYLAGSSAKNNLLLITGHSRGAAVANIIAHELNKTSNQDKLGIDKLYAFTFATPNLTTVANKNETNIFNYCFSDDFIPQVPLKQAWGYDKHGITFEVAATDLYKSNTNFITEMDLYASTQKNFMGEPRTKASFNQAETQKIVGILNQNWSNLESYYTEKCPIDSKTPPNSATLYEYLRNSIATAITGDISGLLSSISNPPTGKFRPLINYVYAGYLTSFLFDSHSMTAYYSALKNDGFNANYPSPTSVNTPSNTPTSQVIATPSSTIATTTTPTTTSTITPTSPIAQASTIVQTSTITPTPTKAQTTATKPTPVSPNHPSATAKNEPDGKIPSTVVLKDVEKHWAKDKITKLVSLKIISGYEDSTFKPDNTITRAELASIIVKALGLPLQSGDTKFTDDKSIPAWAKSYVKTASEKGIINGYKDLTFKPSQPCTRQEIITMIMKASEFGESTKAVNFKDLNQIQSWSKGYISKAIELEIVNGYNDMTFKPNRHVTRAEAATMILKSIEAKKVNIG